MMGKTIDTDTTYRIDINQTFKKSQLGAILLILFNGSDQDALTPYCQDGASCYLAI